MSKTDRFAVSIECLFAATATAGPAVAEGSKDLYFSLFCHF